MKSRHLKLFHWLMIDCFNSYQSEPRNEAEARDNNIRQNESGQSSDGHSNMEFQARSEGSSVAESADSDYGVEQDDSSEARADDEAQESEK